MPIPLKSPRVVGAAATAGVVDVVGVWAWAVVATVPRARASRRATDFTNFIGTRTPNEEADRSRDGSIGNGALEPQIGAWPLARRSRGPRVAAWSASQCGWAAVPMNNAVRKVKTYAWRNATNSSRKLRATTPPTLAGVTT